MFRAKVSKIKWQKNKNWNTNSRSFRSSTCSLVPCLTSVAMWIGSDCSGTLSSLKWWRSQWNSMKGCSWHFSIHVLASTLSFTTKTLNHLHPQSPKVSSPQGLLQKHTAKSTNTYLISEIVPMKSIHTSSVVIKLLSKSHWKITSTHQFSMKAVHEMSASLV